MRLYDNYGMRPVVILSLACLIIMAIGFGVYRISVNQCRVTADNMNTEMKFELFGEGCYLKVGDNFVPSNKIRITQEGEVLP